MAAMLRAGRTIAALALIAAALCPSASAAPLAVDEPYSVVPVWSSCAAFVGDV